MSYQTCLLLSKIEDLLQVICNIKMIVKMSHIEFNAYFKDILKCANGVKCRLVQALNYAGQIKC